MSEPLIPGAVVDEPTAAVLEQAARGVRAPWAASVAGLLFAGLFTLALVLLRTTPIVTADDRLLLDLVASGGDLPIVVGALYFGPFSGVAFLWFVAVIRDQIGEREDRFFATVFFGSGLLFVAMIFAAFAVAATLTVSVRFLDQAAPTADEVRLIRSLSYTLLFAFATRAGAVFLFSTATLGLRTGTFPRWFALTGYAAGLVLLLVVTVFDWVILLLPAWVAVISVFILRRERARQRPGDRGAAPGRSPREV